MTLGHDFVTSGAVGASMRDELATAPTRTGPKRWLARHGLDGLGDDA